MREFRKKMRAFFEKLGNKKAWRTTVTVLSGIVVFCTVYMLILPAITLSTSQDTVCGIEQHTHTDACYEIAGVPAHDEICCNVGAHVHSDECYDEAGNIICGYSDKIIHQHNEYCFDDDGELICTLPEYSGEYHVHSNQCFDNTGKLVCGKLETVAHQHTEECVTHIEEVAPQNLICEKQEHTHTDECFEYETVSVKAELAASGALASGGLASSSATPKLASSGGTGSGVDGLEMTKTLRLNEDGTYTLRLETYVTGVTVTETKHIPQDIVIVLDVSQSMADNYLSIYNSSMSTTLAALDTNYGATQGMYVYGASGYKPTDDGTYEGWSRQEHKTADKNDMRYQDGKWQYYKNGKTWTDVPTGTNVTVYISRFDSLKIAVCNFIDQIKADGVANGITHRVSIVKYSGYMLTESGCPEINGKTFTSNYEVGNNRYNDGYEANYTQIVSDITELNETNANALKSSVKELYAIGGTLTDYGIELGQYVLNKCKVTDGSRQQYMVLFTDGEPIGRTSKYSGQDATYVKNRSISLAKEIKKTAKIYTIGCFSGTVSADTSTLLEYISSDYSNATSLSSGGTKDGSDYYLTVSSATQMTEIFEEVQESLSKASIELDENTMLQDGITENYDIVTKAGNWDVQVWTESYAGSNTWTKDSGTSGITVVTDISNKRVQVTGFDYAENYVTDTPSIHGKKLVVEIPIKYASGSGDLPTNTPDSGIYIPDGNGGYVGLSVFVQPKCEQPSEVKVSLTTKNHATDGPYDFTINNVLKYRTYDTSAGTETDKIDLTGFNNFGFSLSKNQKSDVYYARDDSYDGVTGNNDHPVKIYFTPTAGYTVTFTMVDSESNETVLTVKTEGEKKYVEFMPTGNVEIKIVEDYRLFVDLTIKPVIAGSSDKTQVFHYTVQYNDYDGNSQTKEKDLTNGDTWTLEDVPKGKAYNIVETGYTGMTVEYRNESDTATLISGDTYTISSLDDDTTLIVKHTTHAVLPKTGSSGGLVVFSSAVLMVTASLIGLAVTVVKEKKKKIN